MQGPQDQGNASLASLDQLQHAIEAAERHVAKERRELPQKGLPGWVHATGRAANASLIAMDKAIGNASLLLRDLNQKSSLSEQDIKNIRDETTAMENLLSQKVVVAKTTRSGEKLEARQNRILLTLYKDLYVNTHDTKNPFYFEDKFKQVFNNKSFANYAKKLSGILEKHPEKLLAALEEKNVYDLLRELGFKDDLGGDTLIPFLRLLILKMDNPSVLNQKTDKALTKISDEAQYESNQHSMAGKNTDKLDQNRGLLMYLQLAIKGLKQDLNAVENPATGQR